MLACMRGHHDVAVMLISKGADINHTEVSNSFVRESCFSHG